MVKRLAIVVDGVVVNVIKAEDGFQPEVGQSVESETAGVGWLVSGDELVPPADNRLVPEVVSRRQALLAIHASGLAQTVADAVASAGDIAQIEWENAVEFRRDHPLITQIAAAIELSPANVDNLFRTAGRF